MIENIVRRLIENAPEINNLIVTQLKADVPANATRRYLECQVVLKGGYSMAGVLTFADTSDGDTLQLVAVAQTPDKKVVLAEHFFTFDDVATIIIARQLPEQLVHPGRANGSPIIMGH